MDQGLLNPTAVKIVEAFTEEGHASLYFTQIADVTGITSKNNLLRHLALLVRLGILTREQQKNNTFYHLNIQHPVTQAAIRLMNVTRVYELVQNKWYVQHCNATPIHLMSAALSAIITFDKTGLRYHSFLYDCKEEQAKMMYSLADLEHLSEILLKKLHSNSNYFKEMKMIYDADQQTSYALYRELSKRTFSELSDSMLASYIKRASYAIGVSVGVGHIIEPFALITDLQLKDKIAPYFKDQKALNEAFITLTTPVQKSFAQEAEDLLVDISHAKDKNALVEDYIARFYWIKNSYSGRHVMTHKEVLEQSSLVTSKKKNVDISEKRNALLKSLNLPAEFVSHFEALEFLTFWQDERKKHILMGIDALDSLLEELSRRLSIDIKLLRYLSPEESIRDLDNIRKLVPALEERRQGSIFYQIFSKKSYVGGTVTTLDYKSMRQFIDNTNTQETKVINGQAAALGTAIGRVRVCLSLSSLQNIKDGDILVASMTRPEYLTAMKKAAAFVTDEGGITCHAAIVAREMKKPCVIGTKYATQFLRDGDLVQVKGNHGVVILLERPTEENKNGA